MHAAASDLENPSGTLEPPHPLNLIWECTVFKNFITASILCERSTCRYIFTLHYFAGAYIGYLNFIILCEQKFYMNLMPAACSEKVETQARVPMC